MEKGRAGMGLGLTSRLGGEISATRQLKMDFRLGTPVPPLTHAHLPCACGPRSAPAAFTFLEPAFPEPAKKISVRVVCVKEAGVRDPGFERSWGER
jgi:hypothetical protein